MTFGVGLCLLTVGVAMMIIVNVRAHHMFSQILNFLFLIVIIKNIIFLPVILIRK